jgi:hypothetical protein
MYEDYDKKFDAWWLEVCKIVNDPMHPELPMITDVCQVSYADPQGAFDTGCTPQEFVKTLGGEQEEVERLRNDPEHQAYLRAVAKDPNHSNWD